MDRTSLPEGNRQIFLMSDNISDDLKEDMAWASYALLRNTNSISVVQLQISLKIRSQNLDDSIFIRYSWSSTFSYIFFARL